MSALARSLGDYQANGHVAQIDPKAVGSHLAHRPLTRRRSNPPGSPDSDDGLFASQDSLSSLPSLLASQLVNSTSINLMMQQLHQHQQQQNAGHQQQQQRGGHRKLDRSHSEPVTERSAQNGAPGNSNSSRYKTELCRPFEENGTCKYGDKCQFAHGMHELRSLIRHPKYKTELCRTFHTIGFCPYGPRCHFIHNADEARNNSPTPPMSLSGNNAKNGGSASSSASAVGAVPRSKFILPVGNHGGSNGSTADSPSPPSSLSESPTSMSAFFADDLLSNSNPFSPAPIASASAFLFGNDFVSPLFASGKMSSSASFGGSSSSKRSMSSSAALPGFSNLFGSSGSLSASSSSGSSSKFMAELDSPSPVGSLASDLDSLSLGCGSSSSSSSSGGASPPPPPATASAVHISSPMDTSRALRLPIFSRISETLNED